MDRIVEIETIAMVAQPGRRAIFGIGLALMAMNPLVGGCSRPSPEPGQSEAEGPTPAAETPAAIEAVEVVRHYYEAIAARDFRQAYGLWGSGGGASGETYEEFATSFAETATVEVEVGEPGRVEPAAGSWFVSVPVVIHLVAVGGAAQRLEGTYTLRRGVVVGMPPQPARWRIYSVSINRVGNG